jgi:division protein CdvB (Snf7/Vps24/ESCRT-III family)
MMIVIEDPITDTIADAMQEFNKAVDKYGWEFAKIVSGPTLIFEGIVCLQMSDRA